jgi:multidrug efflux pump
MLSATLLAIFFVPVFFVVVLGLFKVQRLSEKARREAEEAADKTRSREHEPAIGA